MKTYPCPSGCGREFHSIQGANLHNYRTHTHPKKKKEKVAKSATETAMDQIADLTRPTNKPRRKYTRRPKTPPGPAISFCPHCGGNIATYLMAATLAQEIA